MGGRIGLEYEALPIGIIPIRCFCCRQENATPKQWQRKEAEKICNIHIYIYSNYSVYVYIYILAYVYVEHAREYRNKSRLFLLTSEVYVWSQLSCVRCVHHLFIQELDLPAGLHTQQSHVPSNEEFQLIYDGNTRGSPPMPSSPQGNKALLGDHWGTMVANKPLN